LIKLEDISQSYRPISAFETVFVEIHYCTSSSKIGGSHVEISHIPFRRRMHQIGKKDYDEFKGDFDQYFAHFISLDKTPSPATHCWRTKDTVPLCPGERTDICYLVASLPFILSFEVGDEKVALQIFEGKTQKWDFPPTLLPVTEADADSHGLIYDLVGLALVNRWGNHFIARYASPDKSVIYTYDGNANEGFPIREDSASFRTHMSGRKIKLPNNYLVYQVLYRLRGGATAQDQFFRLQTAELSRRFGFQFSTKNLNTLFSVTYHDDKYTQLDNNKRLWLLNPWRSQTLEYVSQSAHGDMSDDALDIESEDENPLSKPNLPEQDISSSPPLSLPNSEFDLNCRCGIIGDSNILYQDAHGEAIQCNECREWSHIACQRDGRASDLAADTPFICDVCDLSHHLPVRAGERKSKRM
jgi:hypothetical protein